MRDQYEESLAKSPIFVGLTRPPMLMGITLDYLSIAFMFSVCAFISMNSIRYLLIYLPLHIIGWIACRFDHHIFHLLLKKWDCLNVPNKRLWGCQSYAPF